LLQFYSFVKKVISDRYKRNNLQKNLTTLKEEILAGKNFCGSTKPPNSM